ncbi:hypothetical protein [Prauserella endophytica]|uniref:Uncharacterized protein n=1 Tax=Prauserella endophytica TaxID=1592324 RepID=A0ABY2RS63_9PSEU|nr:hypothetical protein [Prauserella endophytica]TKG58049.1 hypothetical protein FCN18_38480 [Prauserella endophytica]
MVALAVETGIPPSVWADESERDIITAVAILEEREKAASRGKSTRSARREPGAGGPTEGMQLSG